MSSSEGGGIGGGPTYPPELPTQTHTHACCDHLCLSNFTPASWVDPRWRDPRLTMLAATSLAEPAGSAASRSAGACSTSYSVPSSSLHAPTLGRRGLPAAQQRRGSGSGSTGGCRRSVVTAVVKERLPTPPITSLKVIGWILKLAVCFWGQMAACYLDGLAADGPSLCWLRRGSTPAPLVPDPGLAACILCLCRGCALEPLTWRCPKRA